MKQTKFKRKKQYITAEKRLENIHYRIIIGLIIFYIAYHAFIEPKTIGHDIKYAIYIFWLPTIFGMLILAFYRRQFLINRWITCNKVIERIFIVFFYSFQGFLFSYLSFGQFAKMSWDSCNYFAFQKSSEETIVCPITRFWTGKQPCIDFRFKGNHESIRVKYSSIKEFVDKEELHLLKLQVTEGIWNYYKVNEWRVEEK